MDGSIASIFPSQFTLKENNPNLLYMDSKSAKTVVLVILKRIAANLFVRRNILKCLSLAYGQMILKSGFFHADPHPGNILICKGSEVSQRPVLIEVISSSSRVYLNYWKIM